jgi:TPP-dependent pyruvate/acetoin dehydrogenase alpha subunit
VSIGSMLELAEMIEIYRTMVEMRRCDGRAQGGERYDGEEAVAAGALLALDAHDLVVSSFRPRGHRLARNRRGADDSQFIDGDTARAVELARTLDAAGDRERIVCCVFGDAVLGAGVFHESMNIASNEKLPIVFVCENNFYGMGTLFDGAICQEDLYRFAAGYKMPSVRVDGMEVLEVYAAAREAAAHVRSGEGPSIVDAVTYRPLGEYRTREEEIIVSERDPIRTFRGHIVEAYPEAVAALDAIDREILSAGSSD